MGLETGLPPCVHEGHPHRGKLCLFHSSVHLFVHPSAQSPSLPVRTLPTPFAELCRCPVWGLEQEAAVTSSFPHPVCPALLSGAMRVTSSDCYPVPECQDLLSSLCLGSPARSLVNRDPHSAGPRLCRSWREARVQLAGFSGSGRLEAVGSNLMKH